MTIKNLFILILICILYTSCDRSIEKSDKPRFDSIVWIFDNSIDPDSLKNFVDNYMIIDTTDVTDITFNGDYLGDFRLSHDTVRIVNISYLVISADSMEKQESLVFEGIVTKHTKDSLVFKRLRGYFPLKYRNTTLHYNNSDKFIFYNEELLKKNNQRLEELSFSNSSCYGKCPEIACEIDSNRNIKFYGGSFAEKKGFYFGTVKIDYFNKLNNILSYVNLEKDSTIFPVPIDAPANEIRIKTNNKTCYFTGTGHYYPNKLFQLYILLLEVAQNSKLQATKDTFNFKTTLHNPPPIITTTVKFKPPKAE